MKNGLVAFDASSLQGMGRIATEGDDYPIGVLSPVDLDGDRVSEVVMSTNAGRVVAVNVIVGSIKWSTVPGYSQASASFADLDGDAHPDVIVAGRQNFAGRVIGCQRRCHLAKWRRSTPLVHSPGTRGGAVIGWSFSYRWQ